MALGDAIATQGDRLGEILIQIMNNKRLQDNQIRQARFNAAIQRILEDKARKAEEARQKTARQQAMVQQIGIGLLSAGGASALSGLFAAAPAAGAGAGAFTGGGAGGVGGGFGGIGGTNPFTPTLAL